MISDDAQRDAVLRQVAREFGTPCFVYFMDHVRARAQHVRAAFGNRFRISYAVKSNPNSSLLRRLLPLVDGLDVSSAGEVRRAVECGWDAGRLSFTGPGKTEEELRAALQVGIGEVIVESLDEAGLVNRLAERVGRRQAVLIRIAPTKVPRGFGLNMSGAPTQFGVDEEEIHPAVEAVGRLVSLDLCGFHIYSGTQCLKADAIVENYEIFIEIFRRVCREHKIIPKKLIFGSGLGIPYYESDAPLDLTSIAERVNPALDGLANECAFAETELVLETGRYLIGEAGIYVTRVVRKKRSRGAEICICDGGMNHHLGAAGHLGAVVPRNYRMFKVGGESDAETEKGYTLVGPLCTSIDTLGRNVKFHGIEAGNLIGITCSGAYGLTASPIHFISHDLPREIVVEASAGGVSLQDASESWGRIAQAIKE